MRTFQLLLISTLLWTLYSPRPQAAALDTPTLVSHAKNTREFVPLGWTIEAQAHGWLKEGRHHATAFVLKTSLPGTDEIQRMIVVIFKSADGGYDLAAQNRTLLPSYRADLSQRLGFALGNGAHVPGLQIDQGLLRLHINLSPSSGPTAERDLTYSFRYRLGRLYLARYEEFVVGSHLGTASNSFDYLTGKARLSSGKDCAGRRDVVAHCRYAPVWKRLKTKRPINIEQIGDGLEFEPR